MWAFRTLKPLWAIAVDRLTRTDRSRVMAAVRSRNTQPELLVRSCLHELGFRFRACAPDLPGRPDVVIRKRRLAIFVHGCFWHGHACPRGALPTTNVSFWTTKIEANQERDKRAAALLRADGWTVHTIWECTTRDRTHLMAELAKLLTSTPATD